VLNISATALEAISNLWEVIRRKTRNLALGRLKFHLEYLTLRKDELSQLGRSIFPEGVSTTTSKVTVSFLEIRGRCEATFTAIYSETLECCTSLRFFVRKRTDGGQPAQIE
jgi:hypothetical protein